MKLRNAGFVRSLCQYLQIEFINETCFFFV